VPHPKPVPDTPVLAEIATGLGLSLTQAARRLPSSRGGRPVHSSCVWRWINDGGRLPDGAIVKLEAARLAGRWLTSTPAIERFLARQTPQGKAESMPAPRTPTQSRKASERAAKELEALGI
jgi:hypothetical protein